MSNKKKKLSATSPAVFDHQRIQGLGGSLIARLGEPCFSEEQMASLRALVDEHGTSGRTDSKFKDVRRSRVFFLEASQHKWVYDIAWKIAKQVNAHYQFDIKPISEMIQIARYDGSEQGCYNWHPDVGPLFMGRKISISIPLNTPSEYKGGDFQILMGGDEHETILQLKGHPITFPSFVWHRVTPVTQGTRYSLVIWVGGPSWR